ncbi:unnamed protein product [Protopolystoma xenopodis]|uniref:Uncharacterized protein n=1 Tax=Protopolystoma xenopodis TaxID=117903 RepID=A0A3S5BR24_9PLAT|nr:unnamed protein product [Protopolystoma xenopodis]
MDIFAHRLAIVCAGLTSFGWQRLDKSAYNHTLSIPKRHLLTEASLSAILTDTLTFWQEFCLELLFRIDDGMCLPSQGLCMGPAVVTGSLLNNPDLIVWFDEVRLASKTSAVPNASTKASHTAVQSGRRSSSPVDVNIIKTTQHFLQSLDPLNNFVQHINWLICFGKYSF